MEAAELKMLQISLGVTKLNMTWKEYIRGTSWVEWFGDKVRETRLRCFEHVQRKDT